MIHKATMKTFPEKTQEESNMQREVPHSNQVSSFMIPLKSETQNDSPAFKQLSVSIPNDGLASTMDSFLSQLTVVPTPSFLHFHIQTNTTSAATEHRINNDAHQTSLNDVTKTHVSLKTATTTMTMTHVPTTRFAKGKAPQFQLNTCKATQAQHKTMNPSILQPAGGMTVHINATPTSLVLLHV
jgi:hypothetical protein